MKYDSLIKKMSLEEKASLMSGKNGWEIPSLWLSDGPHGVRKEVDGEQSLNLNKETHKATCFPPAATMANSWDLDLEEKVGKVIGSEAKALGVDVLLGPGINIKRNPRCGRNFEYYSEDPYLAGKMGGALIKGIQSNGISGCVKHFCANSQETRRMTMDSVVDERALREIYLTNFEIAIEDGKPGFVMSSYNLVNGTYANENKHTLVDILRKEWGYDGVVVSDWGGNNIRTKGLECFSSLEMPGNLGDTNRDIVEAVKNHQFDEKILDQNVNLMLDAITKYHHDGHDDKFDVNKDNDIARLAAEESIVMLKNNNVLPLKSGAKVALIGGFAKTPRYEGGGSAHVNPTMVENTVEEIKKYDLKCVGYEQGYETVDHENSELSGKAIALASKADVILFYMGLADDIESEGFDRINLKINNNQLMLLSQLFKTGKKVVVILTCGAIVEIGFDNVCDAIIYGCLGGQAGASAMLNVLTGKVNPSGKMSETIPYAYKDEATYHYYPGEETIALYKESIYVGYRYFDTHKIEVKYPFGFGLSYSTFEYSDLKITDKDVSFKVANTSKIDGKEVVQLYIGKVASRFFRAIKELKGFKKILLKAGETKEVKLAFDKYSFRYFNVKTNKWEIEGGDYQIFVGGSSRDLPLMGVVKKVGTTDVIPYEEDALPLYNSGRVRHMSDTEFYKLLGHPYISTHLHFISKKRIEVTPTTTLYDLRLAKGFIGRGLYKKFNKQANKAKNSGDLATYNSINYFLMPSPIKLISRFSPKETSYKELLGLVEIFNGHIFKGLKIKKAGQKEREARLNSLKK
jgi:beta-glucosidase